MADTLLSLRERKKQARKDRIEQAALELFRTRGFDRTTVEEIAAAADVGKGTFFNYFPTKEAVLRTIGERQTTRLQEALAHDLAQGELDPVSRLLHVFDVLAHGIEAEENPQLVQLIVFETLRHPELLNQDPNRLRLRQLLTVAIELGQAGGQLRSDVSADLIAQSLEGCYVQQVFQWCADPETFSLADRLRAMVNLVIQGAAGRDI